MQLSKRELEVCRLIAWGASDKEVAQELSISPETSHTYRKYILQKIHGHNVADLTRWYFETEYKVSFGFNPRQIKHIAMVLLLLILFAEFHNIPVVRTRTLARARSEQSAPVMIRTARSRTIRRNELSLA